MIVLVRSLAVAVLARWWTVLFACWVSPGAGVVVAASASRVWRSPGSPLGRLAVPDSRTVLFCPECNVNLGAVPVGEPCPRCGGQRRSAVATPRTITAKMTFPEPSVSIARVDHRPWIEKWRDVVRARDQIDSVYARRQPNVGSAEVDELVTRFCNDCHDMRDWLVGDIGSLNGVAAAGIKAHATSSPPLQVSSAVANSHKHHTANRAK